MTAREAATLAFKLLAVWTALGALAGLESAVEMWYLWPQEQRSWPTMFFPIVLSVAVGAAMWTRAEWLASRMFPRAESAEARPSANLHDVRALALSIIGMLILVETIPELINWASLYAFSERSSESVFGPVPLSAEQRGELFNVRAKASIVAAVTKLAIGLGLLVGSRSITRLLKRMKQEFVGEEPPEDVAGDVHTGEPES